MENDPAQCIQSINILLRAIQRHLDVSLEPRPNGGIQEVDTLDNTSTPDNDPLKALTALAMLLV
jgi:hypothetical protein